MAGQMFRIKRVAKKMPDGSWEKVYDAGYTGWIESNHPLPPDIKVTFIDNRSGDRYRFWPAEARAPQGGGGYTQSPDVPPPQMPGGGSGPPPFPGTPDDPGYGSDPGW